MKANATKVTDFKEKVKGKITKAAFKVNEAHYKKEIKNRISKLNDILFKYINDYNIVNEADNDEYYDRLCNCYATLASTYVTIVCKEQGLPIIPIAKES